MNVTLLKKKRFWIKIILNTGGDKIMNLLQLLLGTLTSKDSLKQVERNQVSHLIR